MSLIEEIKSDLIRESANIANTLRKAKILASQLKLQEFKEWIKFELEGYPSVECLPEYRKLKAHNVGIFSGPFQSMARNVTLPTHNLPDTIKDFAENVYFFDGIRELETMLKANSDSLQRKWPQEAIILARDSIQLSGGDGSC